MKVVTRQLPQPQVGTSRHLIIVKIVPQVDSLFGRTCHIDGTNVVFGTSVTHGRWELSDGSFI